MDIEWILTLTQASLEKAKAWVKELQRQANPNIIIALVGNKVSYSIKYSRDRRSPGIPRTPADS